MKSRQKISFITTIFNEALTIDAFLTSLFNQSIQPDEIIIVDGKSSDNTVAKVKQLRASLKKYKGIYRVIIKKGNRSIGRNEAIKHANGDIIICSDSGNILDNNWVREITEPFSSKNVDVVAGYYKGIAENVFQKCVIPYALVMPDKVNPKNFLPATRSIAFTKKIWKQVGGFDKRLSHNEDYAFAKRLQMAKAKIIFKKDAIVYWKPRNSFKEAFIMMYRFAYGDAEARIFRPKVILVFVRYLIGFVTLFYIIDTKSTNFFCIFIFLILIYLFWAIIKNYKYVSEWRAFFILPALQLIADWAVLMGTTLGLLRPRIRYN